MIMLVTSQVLGRNSFSLCNLGNGQTSGSTHGNSSVSITHQTGAFRAWNGNAAVESYSVPPNLESLDNNATVLSSNELAMSPCTLQHHRCRSHQAGGISPLSATSAKEPGFLHLSSPYGRLASGRIWRPGLDWETNPVER